MVTTMRIRRMVRTAFAFGLAAAGCDGDEDQITGTYELRILETRDTCDNEINQVRSTVTISRTPTGFLLDFGPDARLDGSISEEGVLAASGNIIIRRDGLVIPAFLQVGLVIREGQIRQGTGRLTFNGTFPNVAGTCVQEFTIQGGREDSRVPIVG